MLCVDVWKNFITAASSKDGEFKTSTTTDAPFRVSARPSPVTASTPERRDAATTSWPSPASIVTSPAPMSPLPPTTTIFIRHLSREPLDEFEHLLGDFTPAGVDRQRVPAVRHLDDLSHALVPLLLLVGRVRDREGDRMIRVGGHYQHRTPVGIHRVDLCLRPGVDVRGCCLEERLPGARDGVAEVQFLRLVLADEIRKAVPELFVGEWDRAIPVRRVAQGDAGRPQRRQG